MRLFLMYVLIAALVFMSVECAHYELEEVNGNPIKEAIYLIDNFWY